MNKVTIDFFDQAHFLSNLKASPDGLRAAFLECQCRDEGYAKSLYLCDGDHTARLTSDGVMDYVWENDQMILFSAAAGWGRRTARRMANKPICTALISRAGKPAADQSAAGD